MRTTSNLNQVYFGVVEDRNDPLKLGRCRVRIARCHTHDLSLLPTSDLPWATVVQPVSGSMGQSVLSPPEGTLVQVQFFDYPDNQMPVVTGIIPTIPQEQTVFVDQFEDAPILKDELTPQGRMIPTNDMDATGGISNIAITEETETPTLNNVQQQGLLSHTNNPNALIESMTNQSALQIGAVGALAQFEASVGKQTKSKKDEYESAVLSIGKTKAVNGFVSKLSEKLNSSLPIDLVSGKANIQSVFSGLNSYFKTNGLTDLTHEASVGLGVLNLDKPSDYILNISNGLGDLKNEIRSDFQSKVNALNGKIPESLGDLLSNNPFEDLFGELDKVDPSAIVSSIGNGYTSVDAEAKNIGNITALQTKGADKVTSEEFKEVGEGNTPPTQGTFGGANYGGADPIETQPEKQDLEKYPKGADRELNLTSIGLSEDKVKNLISACNKHGLTTLESRASFFAILYAKNKVKCEAEGYVFEVRELLRKFPLTFSEKETLAKQYSLGKKPEKEFFRFVYDSSNDGRTYGNIYPSDGYQFSGYGYLPIIGRTTYTRYAKLLNDENIVKTGRPYLESNESVCAEIAVLEFLSRTKNIPPTAHPQFFYASCRLMGMDVESVEGYYCSLYGANTQNLYGVGLQTAGNTNAPETFYGNHPNQTDYGYNDPNNRYPQDRTMCESSQNRLTRGDIRDTIVTKKEQFRRLGVPIAMNKGTWNQPHSAYGAKYPFNNVTETESGHIVEYDDTPQHERIHLYHRKGTFMEIDSNGTKVTRIVGDNYTIVDRNGFVSIDGDANVTVSGTVNIYVRNDANIQVEGSTELKVGGSLNMGVAKDFNLAVQGNMNMFANGTFRLQSKKDGHVLTGDDLYVSSTKTSHYKSEGSMYVTSMQSLDTLVQTNRTDTTNGNHNQYCKGNHVYETKGNLNELVEGNEVKEVKGNRSELIGGNSTTETKGNRSDKTHGSQKTENKTHDQKTHGYTHIESEGSIDLKTGVDIHLEANNVHLKGSGSTNIQGSTVNLKGSGAVNLQAGASMNLKAGGAIGLQGKPVNLNSGSVGSAGGATGASGASNADQAVNGTNAEQAKEATKALIYGMIPPPLGTPSRIILPPFESVRPIGESEFMIETVEDSQSPIANMSMNAMVAEEGITNTDEGETKQPSSVVSTNEESPYKDIILNTENFNANFKLSEHFTLGMMFDGGFNNRHKLINQVGLTKQQIVLNLSRLCHNILEKYLPLLPNGIKGYNKQWRITSGFRMCMGKSRSDHPKGCACDIQLCSRNKYETWKLVQELEKVVNYHQLLLEYRGARSVWIHTAYRGVENKKQAMTFVNDRKYKMGFTLIA